MSWRELYQFAASPEAFVDSQYVDRLLSTYVTGEAEFPAGEDLSAVSQQLLNWRQEQVAAYQRLWDTLDGDAEQHRLCVTLLVQSAPIGTTLGCWLQGMSAPGAFEDPTQLSLLSLLADDLGINDGQISRRDEFGVLLAQFGLSAYAGSPSDLAASLDLADGMYGLPSILMAMSRRSDAFHPELCAADWVLRTIGMLPAWVVLRDHHQRIADWKRLDLSLSGDSSIVLDPAACSSQIAQRYFFSQDESARKFGRGVRWVAQAIKRFDRQLFTICEASADILQEMGKLIRSRARQASVYHHSSSLEGCTLSTYFQGATSDPQPLLEVLGRSRLIKPGNSQASLLVNRLVAPTGPMFRVFREDELVTIRNWIDALPAQPGDAGQRPFLDIDSDTQQAPGIPTAVPAGRVPADIRQAYHLLQGRALAPETRAFAVAYVREWLSSTPLTAKKRSNSLPAMWTMEGLRPWLLDQHDAHGRVFEETKESPLPERSQVIDSTLQLAPLILIDGSWLQGFTDVSLATSRVGRSLFRTIWDELGNGQMDLNHPKIYRDLLRSMDVTLPPTGSWEFAADPRIKDQSFRLPVYWLCLGKLSVTFMPEVLGMNLAMELSGVGDGYRSARRFLKAYGFSTQFVDLHNTIDNVDSGHSGWAADAVDAHMRKVAELGRKDLLDLEWDRVRRGYQSLSSLPSKPKRWVGDWLMSVRARFAIDKMSPLDSVHHKFA